VKDKHPTESEIEECSESVRELQISDHAGALSAIISHADILYIHR
jgi:hypothetical protein